MGYEKFSKQRRASKDQAMITILKGGQLSINKVCVEKYLKKYKYVVMYFDLEQRKVGMQPTNDATNDAYNIRFIKDGKLANISVKLFLKHFGIKHEKSVAYSATWNDKEKLVEITLK